MTKRMEQMKFAQKLSRRLEQACDSGNLYAWFEGSHIGTRGAEDNLERANAIFGDCPWTELEFDAKADKAYIYVGKYGKARVPRRAMHELRDFFNTLHNC